MSYILDALNKTEQAKRNQQVPKLDAIQIIPRQEKRFPWWFALAILVVTNIGILFYFSRPDQVSQAPQNVIGPSVPPSAEAPLSAETEVPLQPSLEPVRISALPQNVQRQIPGLAFTSHIYATAPALRMVNINGQRYIEGDTLGEGLKLATITEDGVILTFRHYRFSLPVIRDWTFD